MPVRTVVLPDTYRDSVFLMKLSSEAKKACGARQISAMMGTARNKELFAQSGLSTPEVEAARPGDLVIAIDVEDGAQSESLLDKAVAEVQTLLNAAAPKAKASGETAPPATLEEAREVDPDLGLALISVAGDYARYEAAKAIDAGMDVMLYSDNISLDDEIALKRAAVAKGLLVMGPDCGTAIVKGVPLGFANTVRKGTVGIVGASGTGLQELFCLLDRFGVGITDAYGTGGRDLKDAVGGLTALAALDRLIADPNTRILALIGKPPGKDVRRKLAERVKASGKPGFAHYLGATDYDLERAAGITCADDVTELALVIAKAVVPGLDEAALLPQRPLPKAKTGFLRGLFGGGTLCQEAAELVAPLLKGPKFANMKVAGFEAVSGSDPTPGHAFWDLGDDEFTVGRPHPMMAPELRMARLEDALCDPAVSVVLLDVVIGFGSHPDQAGEISAALARAAERSKGASREKIVVASVCGTDGDTPGRQAQVAVLEQAGVVVLPSNARAAVWAAKAACGGEHVC